MKKILIVFILFFTYFFLFRYSVKVLAYDCNQTGCDTGYHCCPNVSGDNCYPKGINCPDGGRNNECCVDNGACGVGLSCQRTGNPSCPSGKTCQPDGVGGGGGGGGSKTCNQLCVQNSSCISGLSCVSAPGAIGKRCRAPNCQDDAACSCANATPTPGGPTPTTAPVPTDNPNCKCNTLKNCTTQCQFEKLNGVTYPNTIKCGLADSIFQTAPTADNKTSWCRAEKRTKGDADGDGSVTFKDYFYYVTAKLGFKIPASVNPDFNGDNVIDTKDKDIIIKSLLGQ